MPILFAPSLPPFQKRVHRQKYSGNTGKAGVIQKIAANRHKPSELKSTTTREAGGLNFLPAALAAGNKRQKHGWASMLNLPSHPVWERITISPPAGLPQRKEPVRCQCP
jgi:hypothetical protein